MAPVQALTTKQAKASFRARGSSTVTATEKRWLQRDLELERRAERLQEQEKRRAEANKKKLLKEKAARLEKEREQIGTQRRLDRFGHKSSQFHLGNFFGRPKERQERKTEVVMEEVEDVEEDRKESEDFGDDDLDDGTLLEAMGGKTIDVEPVQDLIDTATSHSNETVLPPPQTLMERCDSPQPAAVTAVDAHEEDLDSFWDDFDSGTQIARELAGENAIVTESTLEASELFSKDSPMTESAVKTREDSFSSGSLDLTIEDIERLDVPSFAKPQQPAKMIPESMGNSVSAQEPRRTFVATDSPTSNENKNTTALNLRLMPPPMLPPKQAVGKAHSPFASARDVHRRQLQPPAVKARTAQTRKWLQAEVLWPASREYLSLCTLKGSVSKVHPVQRKAHVASQGKACPA